MSIQEKFLAAVNVINSLPKDGPFQPSYDLKVQFDSYYKQATEGPCNTPKPSFFDSRKHAWHAWKSLGDMPKVVAMQKYVDQLAKVVETMSYTEAVSNFIDVMGPFYEIVWSDSETKEQINCDADDDNEDSDNIPSHVAEVDNGPVFQKSENENNSQESFELLSENPVIEETFTKIQQVKVGYYKQSFDVCNSEYQDVRKRGDVSEVPVQLSSAPTLQNIPMCDILSFAIINLQRSLDDIVRQLDAIEVLAREYKQQEKVRRTVVLKSWRPTRFSLALCVFWPFIVHWIIHVIRRRSIPKSH